MNTILSLTILKYLSEHGQINPGLLAIDSPIRSLKEAGKEKASDTIKAFLFSYLVNCQRFGWIVITESHVLELTTKIQI